MQWLLMIGPVPIPFEFWGDRAVENCTQLVEQLWVHYGVVAACAATFSI